MQPIFKPFGLQSAARSGVRTISFHFLFSSLTLSSLKRLCKWKWCVLQASSPPPSPKCPKYANCDPDQAPILFQMFIFALWLLVVQKQSFFGLILQLISRTKWQKEYGNTRTWRGFDTKGKLLLVLRLRQQMHWTKFIADCPNTELPPGDGDTELLSGTSGLHHKYIQEVKRLFWNFSGILETVVGWRSVSNSARLRLEGSDECGLSSMKRSDWLDREPLPPVETSEMICWGEQLNCIQPCSRPKLEPIAIFYSVHNFGQICPIGILTTKAITFGC